MKRRNKCNFCENVLRGLKGFVTHIFTGLVLIVPIWVINKFFILEKQLFVVAGLLMFFLIIIYFAIWGWAGKNFWKWN